MYRARITADGSLHVNLRVESGRRRPQNPHTMIRATGFALTLAAAGCAHAPLATTMSTSASTEAPRAAAIETPLLVVNPPPHTLYRYIGRVRGVARSSDLVSAASAANDDLRWKAHALGADVVRIDYVAAPPEHGRPRSRVLLAGRAYKAIQHQ